MLIYAKNNIFAYESQNKPPKLSILGGHVLFYINNTIEAKINIHKNFLFFIVFLNFLCISLFFQPFVFVVFLTKICRRHFLKHYHAKIK